MAPLGFDERTCGFEAKDGSKVYVRWGDAKTVTGYQVCDRGDILDALLGYWIASKCSVGWVGLFAIVIFFDPQRRKSRKAKNDFTDGAKWQAGADCWLFAFPSWIQYHSRREIGTTNLYPLNSRYMQRSLIGVVLQNGEAAAVENLCQMSPHAKLDPELAGAGDAFSQMDFAVKRPRWDGMYMRERQVAGNGYKKRKLGCVGQLNLTRDFHGSNPSVTDSDLLLPVNGTRPTPYLMQEQELFVEQQQLEILCDVVIYPGKEGKREKYNVQRTWTALRADDAAAAAAAAATAPGMGFNLCTKYVVWSMRNFFKVAAQVNASCLKRGSPKISDALVVKDYKLILSKRSAATRYGFFRGLLEIETHVSDHHQREMGMGKGDATQRNAMSRRSPRYLISPKHRRSINGLLVEGEVPSAGCRGIPVQSWSTDEVRRNVRGGRCLASVPPSSCCVWKHIPRRQDEELGVTASMLPRVVTDGWLTHSLFSTSLGEQLLLAWRNGEVDGRDAIPFFVTPEQGERCRHVTFTLPQMPQNGAQIPCQSIMAPMLFSSFLLGVSSWHGDAQVAPKTADSAKGVQAREREGGGGPAEYLRQLIGTNRVDKLVGGKRKDEMGHCRFAIRSSSPLESPPLRSDSDVYFSSENLGNTRSGYKSLKRHHTIPDTWPATHVLSMSFSYSVCPGSSTPCCRCRIGGMVTVFELPTFDLGNQASSLHPWLGRAKMELQVDGDIDLSADSGAGKSSEWLRGFQSKGKKNTNHLSYRRLEPLHAANMRPQCAALFLADPATEPPGRLSCSPASFLMADALLSLSSAIFVVRYRAKLLSHSVQGVWEPDMSRHSESIGTRTSSCALAGRISSSSPVHADLDSISAWSNNAEGAFREGHIATGLAAHQRPVLHEILSRSRSRTAIAALAALMAGTIFPLLGQPSNSCARQASRGAQVALLVLASAL
ncbi:hypothetical protein SODALDRAFT_358413 [Sodiomyces alkalinus F11]|uniref:Uncharacterized protein n=1 Tax=Sodiomyces alkalinus (strain CBS 110278 / VKM F-3762 / F11) TaxID=1314773 RepID=A0A3N2PZY6_SODAK|nr:hypothetical protein SODALDRAFT_358413 [Sodiomyces alkalinus F11]ROT39996.1 hypothetical protein SODALDRAFT_358413 [Sodiomyces alkalinus F11]